MKNKSNKKLIIALALNIIIVGLEIVGVVFSVQKYGIGVFKFYTENSNYFALIVSTLFCVNAIIALRNKSMISRFAHNLRFVSTVCLTVTLLVVLLVLIPMYPNTFINMMFLNSNLYQHLLCPVLSIISFVFFENQQKLQKNSIFYAIIPTLVYGTVCIVLNLFRIITGPYPFFYVYEVPWYFSTFMSIGIFLGAILVAYIIYAVHNRGKNQKTKLQAKRV